MVFWPQIDQEIHLRCRVGSDVSMNQLSQSQALAGAQITLGPSNNQEKFKDSDFTPTKETMKFLYTVVSA